MGFKIGIIHANAPEDVEVMFHVGCGLVSIDAGKDGVEDVAYLTAKQWRQLVTAIQATSFEAPTHETTFQERAEEKALADAAARAARAAEDERLAKLGLVR